MNVKKLHIVLSSLMLLFLGASLTVSTVHSHHHIQWHHSGDFTDTGNCVTADTSICPICGYHLKFSLPSPAPSDAPIHSDSMKVRKITFNIPDSSKGPEKGRSPPFTA